MKHGYIAKFSYFIFFLFLQACSDGLVKETKFQNNSISNGLTTKNTTQGELKLLNECNNTEESRKFVKQVEKVVFSWFAVIKKIDSCEIDSARYYTSDHTIQEILIPLNHLELSSSNECRWAANSLRRIVVKSNLEIRNLLKNLLPLCQLNDFQQDTEETNNEFNQKEEEIHGVIRKYFPHLSTRKN